MGFWATCFWSCSCLILDILLPPYIHGFCAWPNVWLGRSNKPPWWVDLAPCLLEALRSAAPSLPRSSTCEERFFLSFRNKSFISTLSVLAHAGGLGRYYGWTYIFYKLPRWSWSLQVIEAEGGRVHFNLGQDLKCILLSVPFELLLILLSDRDGKSQLIRSMPFYQGPEAVLIFSGKILLLVQQFQLGMWLGWVCGSSHNPTWSLCFLWGP